MTTPIRSATDLRILVVGPHPDDETLGAGAILAKLHRLGAELHFRVATGGQRGTGGMERRLAEYQAACAILGSKSTECWRIQDGDLEDNPGLRERIVTAGRAVKANMVITTSLTCYHNDHYKLGLAVRNGRERWGGPPPMMVFMDHFVRGMGTEPTRPDNWFDATEDWEQMRAAWDCYTSQDPNLWDDVELLARLRGGQRDPRVRYAQCFTGPGTAGHDAGLKALIHALDE